MNSERVISENKKDVYKISSIIYFFLFATFFAVTLTNDYSERIYSIPIGGFNLIERDVCFLPLMILFIIFYWSKIYKLLQQSKLAVSVATIFCVYIFGVFLGIINGNTVKNIGFALRQVIYLLIYFPLTYYLSRYKHGIQNFKKAFLYIFYITFSLSIILSILNYGDAGINFRGMFFWIDDPSNSGTFMRILVAGALYYPFFFFTSLVNFWGKLSKTMIFLSLIGLFLTFTRSYWIGTILGILYFFIVQFFRKGRKRNYKKTFYYVLITAACVLLAYIAVPSLMEAIVARFLSSEDLGSGAISYRLIEATSFVEQIQKSLYIGHGTGAAVLTLDPFDQQGITVTPFSHNSYLIYLLYFGLIGTLIILFSIFRSFFVFRKKSILSSSNDNKRIYIALGATLITLLGMSFTASEVSYAGGYFQMGIIFAISEYLSKNNYAV